MEVQEGTGTVTVIGEKKFSLKELAENYESIKSSLEANSEESDDLYEMHTIAKHLLAGKLDRAISLKESLVSHINACNAQIRHNSGMIDQIDFFIEEAVNLTAGKRIDGLAYHAKIKTNPPSVVIDDQKLIPDEYKNWEFEAKDKFPAGDKEKYSKYVSFVLGKEYTESVVLSEEEVNLLSSFFEQSVDKNKLKADIKVGKKVSGASLHSSTKLDIKPGKSIPAKKKELNEG